MEIIIGGPPAVKSTQGRQDTSGNRPVEGKVVAIREGRRKRAIPDPPNSKVITLVVPEGFKIPKDAASGKYRIFLRFSQPSI